jgi:hypothetical protein
MINNKSISIAKQAIRLCAEDGRISSFADHEKTILDNKDFIYWIVTLAQREEREACAKVCEEYGPTLANGLMLVEKIRARGEA